MKSVARLLVLWLAVLWPLPACAEPLADYMEARKVYMAAAACMAAYSSRPGSIAVAAFEQEGWRLEPFKATGDKADAKFLVAWAADSLSGRDVYLVAAAGTESVRDAKVDIRADKVYFAGSTLEEFAANAVRKDLPPDAPRVHEGFNQAAQVMLNAASSRLGGPQAGSLRMLANILQEERGNKIYLTGHSLGGAVVTLVAARLMDMGVEPGQIEVITFGAPAVGNEAFARIYGGKIDLTRFVVEGDPVPEALRKVFGGYRHIGREVTWRVPEPLKRYFTHDLPLYLDLALKNYYLKRRAALQEGLISRPAAAAGQNRLCVAPIRNSLPEALQKEFPFMREALWEEYERLLPGAVTDMSEPGGAADLERAAAAGCSLLVEPEVQGVWVREKEDYYVSLYQTIYRVSDASFVDAGIYGSSTKELTPLDALIHGFRTMKRDNAAWAETR